MRDDENKRSRRSLGPRRRDAQTRSDVSSVQTVRVVMSETRERKGMDEPLTHPRPWPRDEKVGTVTAYQKSKVTYRLSVHSRGFEKRHPGRGDSRRRLLRAAAWFPRSKLALGGADRIAWGAEPHTPRLGRCSPILLGRDSGSRGNQKKVMPDSKNNSDEKKFSRDAAETG